MADDFSEKTEQPTPRKLHQAREKGNVTKSQELTSSFMLLGGILLLAILGDYLYQQLRYGMLGVLSHLYQPIDSIDMATYWMRHGLFYLLILLLPFLSGMIVLGFIINIFQVGWFIAPDALSLKWNRLNPLDPSNLGKFFNIRAIVRLLQGTLKILAIGLICYFEIKDLLIQLSSLVEVSVAKGLYFIAKEGFFLALRLALMLMLLGFADWLFQRWKRMQELMMSRQEIKEEHKQLEGDPKIKSRIRAIMRSLLQKRMKSAIPKANVVITNPIHYAVAIQYDEKAMHAPICVGKGARRMAQSIKEIARQHNIPILENPPLARALYRSVEAGQAIPPQFYHPIAEVLAYIYRLNEAINHNEGITPYKPTPVNEEMLVSKRNKSGPSQDN
jgi:flagellar biosynthetic protein FlhB